jgi:hypothetical protein
MRHKPTEECLEWHELESAPNGTKFSCHPCYYVKECLSAFSCLSDQRYVGIIALVQTWAMCQQQQTTTAK